MKHKVFIDGQEGTTGLKIFERLENRCDIELMLISPDKRKDSEERKKMLNASDISILCLPDTAAVEAVSLIDNDKTVVIDASTAHRTNPDWAYGIPELSKEHRLKIASSKRISVPGCHASGFNAAVYPLVKSGIVSKDYPFVCNSLTGYSGGGKAMIADYENPDLFETVRPARPYALLNQKHKHLPEMKKISGLAVSPIFLPVLGYFYNGMIVSVPLHISLLNNIKTAEELHAFYKEYYKDSHFIRVMNFQNPDDLEGGIMNPCKCNDTNFMDIFVFGDDERILVSARFDNLGKGASGAAVQNLNIVMGAKESEGL